eukprot:3696805-Rhodomonas_salina.1
MEQACMERGARERGRGEGGGHVVRVSAYGTTSLVLTLRTGVPGRRAGEYEGNSATPLVQYSSYPEYAGCRTCIAENRFFGAFCTMNTVAFFFDLLGISLGARYAASGTELACVGTRGQQGVGPGSVHVTPRGIGPGMRLHDVRTMPGTDVAYGASSLQWCYAMPGTAMPYDAVSRRDARY